MVFDIRSNKPLKLAIHQDIIANHPDINKKALRNCLYCYCHQMNYLWHLRTDVVRYDLLGSESGTVTSEQAKEAKKEIVIRQKQQKKQAVKKDTTQGQKKAELELV